jgi:hypothetical protein
MTDGKNRKLRGQKSEIEQVFQCGRCCGRGKPIAMPPGVAANERGTKTRLEFEQMQIADERRSKLEAALEYARRGWPVLPVRGKKPLIKNWPEAATTDEVQIRNWWGENGCWRDANIGVVTGRRSGLIILDVDTKNGKRGEETLRVLEERNGPLPRTLKSRTASGGSHYVYRMQVRELKSRKPIWKGADIDLLADGSFFVAPPSTIGGNSYEWTER